MNARGRPLRPRNGQAPCALHGLGRAATPIAGHSGRLSRRLGDGCAGGARCAAQSRLFARTGRGGGTATADSGAGPGLHARGAGKAGFGAGAPPDHGRPSGPHGRSRPPTPGCRPCGAQPALQTRPANLAGALRGGACTSSAFYRQGWGAHAVPCAVHKSGEAVRCGRIDLWLLVPARPASALRRQRRLYPMAFLTYSTYSSIVYLLPADVPASMDWSALSTSGLGPS